MDPSQNAESDASGIVPVIDRNIRTLLARRQAEEQALHGHERLADVVTRFTGSMTFVGIHVALYSAWIAINLGWIPGIKPFDPTFVVLAMEASVEAIFLSTFILITQNRMMALADRRADLNLQVSLLAEHEITRLIKMVAEMAKRMGLETADDPELSVLSRDIRPEKVLDTLEKHEKDLFEKS